MIVEADMPNPDLTLRPGMYAAARIGVEKRAGALLVPVEAVVSCPDANSIYEVPMILEEQGLTDFLLHRLKLEPKGFDLTEWKEFAHRILNPNKTSESRSISRISTGRIRS